MNDTAEQSADDRANRFFAALRHLAFTSVAADTGEQRLAAGVLFRLFHDFFKGKPEAKITAIIDILDRVDIYWFDVLSGEGERLHEGLLTIVVDILKVRGLENGRKSTGKRDRNGAKCRDSSARSGNTSRRNSNPHNRTRSRDSQRSRAQRRASGNGSGQ